MGLLARCVVVVVVTDFDGVLLLPVVDVALLFWRVERAEDTFDSF